MPRLELTIQEQYFLAELLETSLEHLEIEIERTDSHDYRDALKERRALMRSVRDKVMAEVSTAR